MSLPRVAVLGGGPDAEREVSLNSSQSVHAALVASGKVTSERIIVDRITLAELRAIKADVFFPVLHGPFGEGGAIQDLLEQDGRPYVGCGPVAARASMDKICTKLVAARVGVHTLPASILLATDPIPPRPLPLVIKPVHEGSSVGVRLCRDRASWDSAFEASCAEMRAIPGRVFMVEPLVTARELTVGVLDPGGARERVLEPVEIIPAVEFYDYDAKYLRSDTKYQVGPSLSHGMTKTIQRRARTLASALGIRDLCRIDFLLATDGEAWLLEVNTMPGFTDHSLLPLAAKAGGLEMPDLTAMIVEFALARGSRTS